MACPRSGSPLLGRRVLFASTSLSPLLSRTGFIALAPLLLLAISANAAPAPVHLRNPYFAITLRSTGISSLGVDPKGHGHYGAAQFTQGILPALWQATAETHVTGGGTKGEIAPLAVQRDASFTIGGLGERNPVMLLPGATLSQTVTIAAHEELDSVAARLPTWNSKTSGVTIRLYRGDSLLAERHLTNLVDNAYDEIKPGAPQGPGEYRVEISNPIGTVGWWTYPKSPVASGSASANGKPDTGFRLMNIAATREVGAGSLRFTLRGSTLYIDARVTKSDASSPLGADNRMTWLWTTTWTKAGYDCSPKAGVVFTRFFTNSQRYMPIQQLKRRDNGGIRFDAPGCDWIEMDGTQTADLRVKASSLHLSWAMTDHAMTMNFETPTHLDSVGAISAHWHLSALPLGDHLPPSFPRFAFSDPTLTNDANHFYWERNFTYGSPADPAAAFFDWSAIMRSWVAGVRDGEMHQLETYPMTPDGYVYTYRNDIGWPLRPTATTDTRHSDTNARFILACWRYWRWTGDKKFLKAVSGRLRAAMRYQLNQMDGKSGLIVSVSKDVQGRLGDQSDNYWDILPFGHLDAYDNIVYYASLHAMAQLDSALGRKSDVDYAALAKKAKSRYNAVFWDNAKGRYIGCVDINGVKHDYGFTFVNIEALYYGLGDAAKAKQIYHWMETEPTSSGKADTYTKFVFAPRASTIHNPRWDKKLPHVTLPGVTPPWWVSWWAGTPYGAQCQDGGAILYVSYFDLMVRLRYFGIENAWKRWSEILTRYRLPDHLCGGSPLYTGETNQQENAGSVGVDYPFAESGMVPCFLLYGVIGVDATDKGLAITPRLPKELDYAEVSGVNWQGAALSIRATRTTVTISGTDKGGRAVKKSYAIPKSGMVVVMPIENSMPIPDGMRRASESPAVGGDGREPQRARRGSAPARQATR